ncbi:ATP synthase F0 subunit B [Candidatus Gracilibacteria bacterium]|nr:ATP synthase F0 subunit B [Candidatus Gracilibacteria bacterium]
MQIDIFILLAQIINFGILYYVFQTFIAKKLNARLEQRKQQLKKLDTAEEHYNQRLSLARQQKQEMLDKARETTSVLMKESESIAKHKAQIIIAKANLATKAILDGARKEAEKERRTMLTQVKKHIIDTSLRLNEKMFGSEKTSREFLEKELSEMK